MTPTPSQARAMVAIVLVGLLAAGAVLLSTRPAASDSAQRAEAGAHKNTHQEAHQEAHDDAHEEGHEEGHKESADKNANPGGEAAHAESPAELLRLTAEQLKAAGIRLQAAGAGELRPAAEFQGEIRFNEDRTTHVVPRLAGVAEAVPASLGQTVQPGQLLAVLASPALAEQRSELLAAQRRREAARAAFTREETLWRERISAEQDLIAARTALQEAEIAVLKAQQKLAAVGAAAGAATAALNRLEIRAPLAGTVVEKHLSLGEAVGESAAVFTLSDLSSVWAEFAVAPQDLALVQVGQAVRVSSSALPGQVEARVSYVGALLGEQTRTARARVTLANPQGAWRPGLFVTVAVQGQAQRVPVAIPAEALQTLEGQPTVFKAVAGGLQPTTVRTGRSDGRTVEVLQGLAAGETIAVANTHVLKSELGKESAEHAH